MSNTRRKFLTILGGIGTFVALRTGSLSGQAKPSSRAPGMDSNKDSDSPMMPEKSPTKAMLESNEKDIKKNIEKLYQLVSDLKAEVEKTDSSQVLSLLMVKKAEEIERLARDIKTRAKG